MLRTINATDKRVWITIYDGLGHHSDYGWCEPNSYRDWGGGASLGLPVGLVKVRGEVKSDAEGSDPTIFDTDSAIQGGNAARIVKGDGNYYFEWVDENRTS
jgi:hypothetical protein